jgi:hypothetical protein
MDNTEPKEAEVTPIEKTIRKAEDPISQEDGANLIALFELDIAKCETQKAKLLMEAARVEAIISANREGIYDIKRRMRGIDYPLPEQKPAVTEETTQG